MTHSSLLRAGSQFHKRAQRYHNPLLTNGLPGAARTALGGCESAFVHADSSMEGMAPIC